MSLLDDFARPCVRLEPARVSDGAGGWKTSWAPGAAFTARLALDTSMEARRAERDGVTSLYTVLADRSAALAYGDYFRDTETGTAYRVTSRPEEKAAPAMSTLPFKSFTAERKEPPQ